MNDFCSFCSYLEYHYISREQFLGRKNMTVFVSELLFLFDRRWALRKNSILIKCRNFTRFQSNYLPGVSLRTFCTGRDPKVNDGLWSKLNFSGAYMFGDGVMLRTFWSGRDPNEYDG